MVDGVLEMRTFTCKDDVWNVIDLIIEETEEMNKMGKSFDIVQSVDSQIPFFACRNVIFHPIFSKDKERYIYCENFKIPAYPGTYGEQPSRWVQKTYIIKKAINKITQKAQEDGK